MAKTNVKYMMIRYFFKGYESLYEEMKNEEAVKYVKKALGILEKVKSNEKVVDYIYYSLIKETSGATSIIHDLVVGELNSLCVAKKN